MMERRYYYAVDPVFPLIAAFIERSSGFVKKGDLIRMSLLCTEMVGNVLLDQKEGAWAEGELVRL